MSILTISTLPFYPEIDNSFIFAILILFVLFEIVFQFEKIGSLVDAMPEQENDYKAFDLY